MVITSLSRHTFCGSDQSLSPQSDRQICSQFSCSLRPCQSVQSYFKLDCFRSRLLLMETFRPRWSQQSYQRAEEKWRGDRAGWLAAAACDLHNLSKFCLLDRKLSRCGLACAGLTTHQSFGITNGLQVSDLPVISQSRACLVSSEEFNEVTLSVSYP